MLVSRRICRVISYGRKSSVARSRASRAKKTAHQQQCAEGKNSPDVRLPRCAPYTRLCAPRNSAPSWPWRWSSSFKSPLAPSPTALRRAHSPIIPPSDNHPHGLQLRSLIYTSLSIDQVVYSTYTRSSLSWWFSCFLCRKAMLEKHMVFSTSFTQFFTDHTVIMKRVNLLTNEPQSHYLAAASCMHLLPASCFLTPLNLLPSLEYTNRKSH